MAPRVNVTATIPAGQSLSNAIDLSVGKAVLFHMPAAWTPAMLTFQLSPDGTSFWNDVVDFKTKEVTLNVRPGTSINMADWTAIVSGFLKLRSGSSKGPVPQEADRMFTITVET